MGRDIVAEALREVAAELDEHRALMQQIIEAVKTIADGQSDVRSKLLDETDRLGGRVLVLERRVDAIEKAAEP